MLLLTLRGTPTCYYGDEIGMEKPELTRDPQGRDESAFGRDAVRTPMHWNASPHAGFTQGVPWLPVAHDYTTVNVAAQRDDPTSMLALFRRIVELRRTLPALSMGSYHAVAVPSTNVFAYVRKQAAERLLIVLNFSAGTHDLDLSALSSTGRLLCTTYLDNDDTLKLNDLTLRPNEGLIIAI